MPVRPGWSDDYWKQLDKDTARKVRTTCPRCGSANTYYNEQYRNLPYVGIMDTDSTSSPTDVQEGFKLAD